MNPLRPSMRFTAALCALLALLVLACTAACAAGKPVITVINPGHFGAVCSNPNVLDIANFPPSQIWGTPLAPVYRINGVVHDSEGDTIDFARVTITNPVSAPEGPYDVTFVDAGKTRWYFDWAPTDGAQLDPYYLTFDAMSGGADSADPVVQGVYNDDFAPAASIYCDIGFEVPECPRWFVGAASDLVDLQAWAYTDAAGGFFNYNMDNSADPTTDPGSENENFMGAPSGAQADYYTTVGLTQWDIDWDNTDVEGVIFANFRAFDTDGVPTVTEGAGVIADLTAPRITLTSPVGGEAWLGGSLRSITWDVATDNFTNNADIPVDLWYSANNGSSWTPIAFGEANDGSYAWTVPAADGSQFMVKVLATDLAGNFGEDKSLAFTIDSTPPTVVDVYGLGSPSTAVRAGDLAQIQVVFSEPVVVNTTGGTPTIELELGPTDGQAAYAGMAAVDRPFFNYTVQADDDSPDLEYTGTGALVLNGATIRDAAGRDAILTLPAIGGGHSLSDHADIVVDNVPPTVDSVAVSGLVDSKARGGSSLTVTWAATDGDHYTPDGAVVCDIGLVVPGDTTYWLVTGTPNDGTQGVTVPDGISAADCVIVVVAFDIARNEDSAFSEAFTVDSTGPTGGAVLSPDAFSYWGGGDLVSIDWVTWTDGFGGPVTVELEYCTDYNTAKTWISIDPAAADTGSYLWSVPLADSDESRVRMRGVDQLGNPSVWVESSGNFVIDSTPPSVPTILAPLAGDAYAGGSNLSIQWDAAALTDNFTASPDIYLDVYFRTDGGAWNYLGFFPNTGSTDWAIPAGMNSDNVEIRLHAWDFATDGAYLTNSSEATSGAFTVDSTEPVVTNVVVTNSVPSRPHVPGGRFANITWTPATDAFGELLPNPITISYSTNGVDWTQIATGEANDGTYTWFTPSINSTTAQVRVCAEDKAGNIGCDDSDQFTIDSTDPVVTNVAVSKPIVNGGGTIDITWTASDPFGELSSVPQPIEILYSTDGFVWAQINIGYSPNTGTYTWNPVLSINFDTVRVMVRAGDKAGNYGYGVSGLFTIDSTLPTGSISTPATHLKGGDIYNISWTATDNNQFSSAANTTRLIDLYDGIGWSVLPGGTGAGSAAPQVLPLDVPGLPVHGNTCTLRISATDQALNQVWVSSGQFVIDNVAPACSINTPEGDVRAGSVLDITWSATDSSGFSTDAQVSRTVEFFDGTGWSVVPGGTGQGSAAPQVLPYTIPFTVNSTECRLRITALDLAGNQCVSTSGKFTVQPTFERWVRPISCQIIRPPQGALFRVGMRVPVLVKIRLAIFQNAQGGPLNDDPEFWLDYLDTSVFQCDLVRYVYTKVAERPTPTMATATELAQLLWGNGVWMDSVFGNLAPDEIPDGAPADLTKSLDIYWKGEFLLTKAMLKPKNKRKYLFQVEVLNDNVANIDEPPTSVPDWVDPNGFGDRAWARFMIR